MFTNSANYAIKRVSRNLPGGAGPGLMPQDSHLPPSVTTHPEIDIDIFLLFRYLRESWQFVLGCLLLALVITACSLRNTPPMYEASMVVSPPVNDAGNGGTGGGISSISSVLSSLGGGGGSSSPQFDQLQYKMTSPSVVRASNEDGQLYAWVYPGLWNPQTRRWVKPTGAKQFLLALVRSFFHKPDWIAPDEVMTAETLNKQILFEAVPKSTLTRVSYRNSDARIAVAMLQRLFSEADRQIREQERRRLRALVANANVMLGETQIADLRAAMAQQIAQSEYRMMNVPDTIDYSARQVERPFVSSLPVGPKIGVALTLAFVSTFVFSAFVAVAFRVVAAEMKRRGKTIPGVYALEKVVARYRRSHSSPL